MSVFIPSNDLQHELLECIRMSTVLAAETHRLKPFCTDSPYAQHFSKTSSWWCSFRASTYQVESLRFKPRQFDKGLWWWFTGKICSAFLGNLWFLVTKIRKISYCTRFGGSQYWRHVTNNNIGNRPCCQHDLFDVPDLWNMKHTQNWSPFTNYSTQKCL